MCLHPDVVSYVAKVMEGVKDMVARGTVSMVTFVVLEPGGLPLERFVFELGKTINGAKWVIVLNILKMCICIMICNIISY